MEKSSDTVKGASKKLEDLLKELDTDTEKGLTSAEAKTRLAKYGENTLGEEEEEGFLDALKEEAREPMILLLIFVGILYSAFYLTSLEGSLLDAVTIFSVIAVLVLSEVYNEWKAEKGVKSLKELTEPRPLVLRDGKIVELPSEELVPGDILPLTVGERIPADTRIVKSYGILVDESSLTGESLPVPKVADATVAESAQVTELVNMALAGTHIVQGEGTAVVVTTGRSTELGHIKELTEEAEEQETPLQEAMEQLTGTLVWFAVFFAVLIPALGYLRGQPLALMILTGLSLAFAVIPEELPIVITMVLAVGTYALSKSGALVKRLRASETLGSVTVIATDKTGTLTEGVMRLSHVFGGSSPADEGDLARRDVLTTGILAMHAQEAAENQRLRNVNPMGAAILDSASKAGIQLKEIGTQQLVTEFSFDSSTKMAAYVYETGGKLRVYASGAPESILSRSSKILKGRKVVALRKADSDTVSKAVTEIALQGERALAFGYKDITRVEAQKPPEGGLTFSGMVSFVDPPRPECREVIAMCKGAGMRVIMLTGDHPDTARAIAAQVGIDGGDAVLTGPDLSTMDDTKLKDAVATTSIYARITPEHKLRIVRALRESGQIVAVTGDGVNDAPALKEAAIGIAMGKRGTDAAKEAADMVLTDDNFVSIGNAVREGRKIFDNLRKGIKYYLAVKVALVLIFILPIILDVPLPFAPIQIILLEMFMDLAASSGFVAETYEPDLMKRPPRDPKAKFLDRPTLTGILLSALCLFVAVSYVYLSVYTRTNSLVYAQTAAFATWIVSHIFLAFVRRSDTEPLLKRGLLSNRVMVIWAIVALAMLVAVTEVPVLQDLVKTAALSAMDWLTLLVASFLATFWIEAVKMARKRVP